MVRQVVQDLLDQLVTVTLVRPVLLVVQVTQEQLDRLEVLVLKE